MINIQPSYSQRSDIQSFLCYVKYFVVLDRLFTFYIYFRSHLFKFAFVLCIFAKPPTVIKYFKKIEITFLKPEAGKVWECIWQVNNNLFYEKAYKTMRLWETFVRKHDFFHSVSSFSGLWLSCDVSKLNWFVLLSHLINCMVERNYALLRLKRLAAVKYF